MTWSRTADIEVTTRTAAPPTSPAAGELVAERYELRAQLDQVGKVRSFRAYDRQTQTHVLVRLLTAGCGPQALQESLTRLKSLCGCGGRYLPGLSDAGADEEVLYTVESLPKGLALSAVLAAKARRGTALSAKEALPLVVRLRAALEALPAAWPHGEISAERVYVDAENMVLTGPFLLAALSPDARASVAPPAGRCAPEVRRGTVTRASDAWAVAALVRQALSGRPPRAPEGRGERASIDLPKTVSDALRALLAENPARRPTDLAGLVAALATASDLPVTRLDPEARPPARRPAPPPKPKLALPVPLSAPGKGPRPEERASRELDDDPVSLLTALPDAEPGAAEARSRLSEAIRRRPATPTDVLRNVGEDTQRVLGGERRRLRDALIVFSALVAAAMIVTAGLLVAERRRSDARERAIEYRLRELQDGTEPRTNATEAPNSNPGRGRTP